MAVLLCISAERLNPLQPLEILGHQLNIVGFDPQDLSDAPRHDLVVLDARQNVLGAKSVARIIAAAQWQKPMLLVVSDGVIAAVNQEWGATDFILDSASLAEVDVRVRLLLAGKEAAKTPDKIETGLVIDLESYSAKIGGRSLDLTFKEFELLRYLNENPGRVFSREQLLSEVWGYDYFGGTRTVDVHIRRLRAKLGEHESIIGTVRNVGYRLEVHAD
ncbi:MAG TPA: response regulator transcription factor [Aquiluna sp.]